MYQNPSNHIPDNITHPHHSSLSENAPANGQPFYTSQKQQREYVGLILSIFLLIPAIFFILLSTYQVRTVDSSQNTYATEKETPFLEDDSDIIFEQYQPRSNRFALVEEQTPPLETLLGYVPDKNSTFPISLQFFEETLLTMNLINPNQKQIIHSSQQTSDFILYQDGQKSHSVLVALNEAGDIYLVLAQIEEDDSLLLPMLETLINTLSVGTPLERTPFSAAHLQNEETVFSDVLLKIRKEEEFSLCFLLPFRPE